jgi:hypothetical protein
MGGNVSDIWRPLCSPLIGVEESHQFPSLLMQHVNRLQSVAGDWTLFQFSFATSAAREITDYNAAS